MEAPSLANVYLVLIVIANALVSFEAQLNLFSYVSLNYIVNCVDLSYCQKEEVNKVVLPSS